MLQPALLLKSLGLGRVALFLHRVFLRALRSLGGRVSPVGWARRFSIVAIAVRNPTILRCWASRESRTGPRYRRNRIGPPGTGLASRLLTGVEPIPARLRGAASASRSRSSGSGRDTAARSARRSRPGARPPASSTRSSSAAVRNLVVIATPARPPTGSTPRHSRSFQPSCDITARGFGVTAARTASSWQTAARKGGPRNWSRLRACRGPVRIRPTLLRLAGVDDGHPVTAEQVFDEPDAESSQPVGCSTISRCTPVFIHSLNAFVIRRGDRTAQRPLGEHRSLRRGVPSAGRLAVRGHLRLVVAATIPAHRKLPDPGGLSAEASRSPRRKIRRLRRCAIRQSALLGVTASVRVETPIRRAAAVADT